MTSLKARVRDRIATEYKQLARARLKRQLLDRLAEAHAFPVPDSMVDIEFDTIWKQIETDREQGRLDPEDVDKPEEDLKAEYRDIAVRRVRLGLLISEVGRHNGIDVTQDELNQGLIAEAQRYPGKEREVLEFYQKTPEAVANLRAPIFEDKVVDFVIDLAKVKEHTVTPDELRAEMEREVESAGKKKASGKSAKAKGAKKGSSAKSVKKAGGKKKTAKKTS